MAHIITSFGGTPYLAPTVGIQLKQDISKEAESFIKTITEEKVDYAVFMTGPGVYSVIEEARSLGLEKILVDALNQISVVARSSKPKDALTRHGIKTDIMPKENTAEGIVKVLKSLAITGKKIAVLWHGSYSTSLRNELESAGGRVYEFSTYSYSLELEASGAKILDTMGFDYVTPDQGKVVKLIEDMGKGLIGAIAFTSPPSARNLFKIAEDHQLRESLETSLRRNVTVVAVGPPTRKALEENGVPVDVMPEIYKMGPMVKALSDYLCAQEASKRTVVAPDQRTRADQFG